MTTHKTDIVIIGAGIAGLWVFHALKRAGYDVVLLEKNAIGGGQSIASQGIIHSGLKYTLAGKVNALARSISAMPDLWRSALKGNGPVDISAAKENATSQHLLIPPGLMGGLVKMVSKQALGNGASEIPQEQWPDEIGASGFKGSLIHMGEPVLDVPGVIRALAEPYKDCIRRIDSAAELKFVPPHPNPSPQGGGDKKVLSYVQLKEGGQKVSLECKLCIFTAAEGNQAAAEQNGHDKRLETQKRPLLMGLMKNAPFPLYAHFVGTSDKPVATITTHKTKDGSLVWYVGGAVAERAKDSNPRDVYHAIQKAFAKYMPDVDLSGIEWEALPIDRVEGKSKTDNWLPDTPTIHEVENALYCWPTKLTFAPMLSDMIIKRVETKGIKPSNTQTDWSFLPEADYAGAPWDEAEWTK